MKSTKIKKTLFSILLILLFVPLIQQSITLFDEELLHGSFTPAEKPDSIVNQWFSGDYQKQYESYYNDNLGFRSFFVRINNQINFSCFGISSLTRATVGKNGYVYETDYIKAYYGDDFNGEENLNKTVNKLKLIQDTLSSLNKNLLIILAAGKASYFPEYIPDRLKKAKNITNNEYYAKQLKEKQIHFIDFNQWFIDKKAGTVYPLFPKTGTHWSTYGFCLAADSLVKYIESLCKTDLPEFYWDNIEVSDSLRDDDMDIEKVMNLFFKIPNHEMAYPQIKYANTEKKKLNCIVVSDSYFTRLYTKGFLSNIFDRGKFWYYNKMIYPDWELKETNVSDVNLGDEISKTDLFIIMSTECNTSGIGWGFIENVYDYFYNNTPKSILETKIKEYEIKIRSTKDWLENLRIKAKENNMTLDSMIFINAEFLAKQDIEKENQKK